MGGIQMTEKIIIKGRGALGGITSGPAIVFPDSIAGNSGALGDVDGVVYEKGNINYGLSIKNAILNCLYILRRRIPHRRAKQ